MFHVKYYTSLLCFYLKGEIWDEGDLVHFKRPNTVLGVIPLGHSDFSMSVAHIASVGSYFKLRAAKLLAGLVLLMVGLDMAASELRGSGQLPLGLVLAVAGAAVMLDAFEVGLSVRDASGTYYNIDFFIFNKKACDDAAALIQQLVSCRSMDTNVRAHADRVVRSIDAVGARFA